MDTLLTVNDTPVEVRTFLITLEQPVNVTWYIDGKPVQDTEKGVMQASYTNTSVALGVWTVNATASNQNGITSQEWICNVTALPQPRQLPAGIRLRRSMIRRKGTDIQYYP